MNINYIKLSEEAKTPYRKHEIDAGFDLTAVWKKETDKYIAYGTKIAFEIPAGYVGLMFPRSSITEMDLMLKNCVGVIDASYRGEISFRFIKAHNDIFTEFINLGDFKNQNFVNSNENLQRVADYYNIGDRVGQIVFVEIPKIKLILVDKLTETERGTSGYGSSGK